MDKELIDRLLAEYKSPEEIVRITEAVDEGHRGAGVTDRIDDVLALRQAFPRRAGQQAEATQE